MPSATQPPRESHEAAIFSASQTQGITDSDIAVLCRFLFRSTNDEGGLPLEHPRRDMDVEKTRGLTHAPLAGRGGFKRSKLVLDALIAISVCTGSQCLALSVSFGPNRVQITIAQNDSRPSPAIEIHLKSIWEQLGELAKLQKQLRHDHNFVDFVHGDPSTSPKSVESYLPVGHHGSRALSKLKDTLERDIHKHCYLKTKQRLKKYLEQYTKFYQFYKENKKALDPREVIADLVFNLLEIHRTVMLYKGSFHPSGVPDVLDWDKLAECSVALFRNYGGDGSNARIKIVEVVDAWNSADKVKNDVKLRSLDVKRGLDKMVSLSRHIQELINFAYSPRLRSMLEKPIKIVRLRPIDVQLTEPSPSHAERIVSRAFFNTPYAQSRYTNDLELLQAPLHDQLSLIPGTLKRPVTSHTVHAEYALLLHHHSERYSTADPPPFQYIAVSKLACFCCWSAYKGYTQMTGRIFSLRGSHSKLYFPWAPTTHVFQDILAEKMRAYLYSQLVGLYSKHLTHLEEERNRLSDSSAASPVAGDDASPDAHHVQASRRRRLEEEAEERG